MIRVLITGSRDWDDVGMMRLALRALWLEQRLPFVIVHGGARGADRMAGALAQQAGMEVEVYPADWETHGKSAGYIRNRLMVRLGADVCLAFIKDESRGATMCAELAEAAGIPVRRYTVDTRTGEIIEP